MCLLLIACCTRPLVTARFWLYSSTTSISINSACGTAELATLPSCGAWRRGVINSWQERANRRASPRKIDPGSLSLPAIGEREPIGGPIDPAKRQQVLRFPSSRYENTSSIQYYKVSRGGGLRPLPLKPFASDACATKAPVGMPFVCFSMSFGKD